MNLVGQLGQDTRRPFGTEKDVSQILPGGGARHGTRPDDFAARAAPLRTPPTCPRCCRTWSRTDRRRVLPPSLRPTTRRSIAGSAPSSTRRRSASTRTRSRAGPTPPSPAMPSSSTCFNARIAPRSTTTEPWGASTAPHTPEPAPKGTMATRSRVAYSRIALTSAVLMGRTTQAGATRGASCRLRQTEITHESRCARASTTGSSMTRAGSSRERRSVRIRSGVGISGSPWRIAGRQCARRVVRRIGA